MSDRPLRVTGLQGLAVGLAFVGVKLLLQEVLHIPAAWPTPHRR